MLAGDIRHDAVQTFFRPLASVDGDLRGAVDSLREHVAGLLELDGVAGDDLRFEVAADLRYVGQEYSLDAAAPGRRRRPGRARAATVAGRFHGAYHARYGHASPSEPIEFVALRLAAVAELRRPAAPGRGGRRRRRCSGARRCGWAASSTRPTVYHRGSLERAGRRARRS